MLSALRHLFGLSGGGRRNLAVAHGSASDGTPTVEPVVALAATFRPTSFNFVGPAGSHHLSASELQDLAERAAVLFRQTLKGRRIGLVFRSEPSLIAAWLGLVSAGFEPLILQYPTEKQNRAVWTLSISNSVQIAALDQIICAPEITELLSGLPAAPVVAFTLKDLAHVAPAERFAFRAEAIIQLSSGTTGHRKAIAFTQAQVARHLSDYNAAMCLGPGDVCVSWLPLYHDMGFVACFLMPMLLGLPVVMIDPIDWVRQPGLLFEAIAAHQGTYCYMPNFGFEIMAKQRVSLSGAGLSTMRRWASCSEPVYADTARRFLSAHAIPAEHFSACYAMAENVFAVTQSDGLVVVEADGVEQVSCGTPIPGVELEMRDGQIFVRSATAVQAYLGGAQVADERGFYPTGDLGYVTADGLVVTGRSGDVLNIAGKKYMLNDLDYAVNQAFPAARGRAAALASFNPRLGTEQLLVLAENEDFFLRDDAAAVAASVAERTGVEAVDVHYVPPGFITKTSSGKINRKKTAADWIAARAFQATGASRGGDGRPLAAVIAELFPKAPRDVPLKESLDSLGLTVVSMLLEERGLALTDGLTVADVEAADRTARTEAETVETEQQIRVFNLGDVMAFQRLTPSYFEDLSEQLGVRVTYEQFCAPPSAVLLNDLIFHDYFMVRDPRGVSAYDQFRSVASMIKSASVLMLDDYSEYYRVSHQFVPAFSHNFVRDPAADQLAWRYQRYTWDHHLHPIRVLKPEEVSTDTEASIRRLAAYLRAPVFRVAFQETAGRRSSEWEHVVGQYKADCDIYIDDEIDFDQPGIMASFARYLRENKNKLVKKADQSGVRYVMEHFHFCSNLINKDKISDLIDRHEKFLIYGPNSSLIYIRNEIERRGKYYKQIMNWQTEGEPFVHEFDCVVETGSWTPTALGTSVPIYQLFWAGYTEVQNKFQKDAVWFYERPPVAL
ncbi:AMP-binding protein [Methylobacterium sp. J-026]|uniref:AMP-binding protein n=1 Tax=Methylobacterium sp. J-026 TaxID=2836624 RepID=UPI001FBC0CCB|nr:AMP-binding protein [Methylobacterium sp. J-026]MCJ2133247.1 AMP-binding protein [Methylobacterium sp. J-026]